MKDVKDVAPDEIAMLLLKLVTGGFDVTGEAAQVPGPKLTEGDAGAELVPLRAKKGW